MYTIEDILARMKNGEDIDTIAQSFANTLNAAKSKYDEEMAEAAKCEAEKAEKVSVFEDILIALYDFIQEYYVNSDEDRKVLDNVFDDVDAEEMLDELESVFGGFIGLLNMTNMFADKDGNVKLKINIPPTTFSSKDAKSADKMIKNFMKSFGW